MKMLLGMVMGFGSMGILFAFAQEIKPGQTEIIALGQDVKLEMVLIPAGKFLMGSNEKEKNRDEYETQHQVTITKPYYIGKYEVTQEQWEAVIGNNPSFIKGAKLPVTNVSWEDCHAFIKKLNAVANGGFRLPTEAEWEYACKAGTNTAFWFGEDITPKDANYGGSNLGRPVAIGKYKPNAFGLHDMHGNVWEWCEDWYGAYAEGQLIDPKGPAKAERRCARGGSFFDPESDARSANRYAAAEGSRVGYIGFRLTRTK